MTNSTEVKGRVTAKSVAAAAVCVVALAVGVWAAPTLVWGGNTQQTLRNCCQNWNSVINAVGSHLDGEWQPYGDTQRINGACTSEEGGENAFIITAVPDDNAQDWWDITQVTCRPSDTYYPPGTPKRPRDAVAIFQSARGRARSTAARRRTAAVSLRLGTDPTVTDAFHTAFQALSLTDSISDGQYDSFTISSFDVQAVVKQNDTNAVTITVALGGSKHKSYGCIVSDPCILSRCYPVFGTCTGTDGWAQTVSVTAGYVCDATGAHSFAVTRADSVGYTQADTDLVNKMNTAMASISLPKSADPTFCPPTTKART